MSLDRPCGNARERSGDAPWAQWRMGQWSCRFIAAGATGSIP